MEKIIIRESAITDTLILQNCVRELHEEIRRTEPSLPPGDQISESYLDYITDRCSNSSGKFFIAEHKNSIVGYICILGLVWPEENDDYNEPYAVISDLYVKQSHRKENTRQQLMDAAQKYARELGSKKIELTTTGGVVAAIHYYELLGYELNCFEMSMAL